MSAPVAADPSGGAIAPGGVGDAAAASCSGPASSPSQGTAGAEQQNSAEFDELAVLTRLEKAFAAAELTQQQIVKDAAAAGEALRAAMEAAEGRAKSDADAAAAAVERDERSVFVNNVDFRTTATELNEFFGTCGAVRSVKILTDKFTGRPRGQAYVEFATGDGMDNALVLNGAPFKDRPLSIVRKRTNVVGMAARGGRGGFSRGNGRGGFPHGGGTSVGRGGGRGRGTSRGRGRGRGRGRARGRGRGGGRGWG